MEVAAVHHQVRRSELLLDVLTERLIIGDLAAIPYAVVGNRCSETKPTQTALDSHDTVHAHRIRSHLNARANARELTSLFVDLDIDPDATQRCRDSEPAHAGADDCDLKIAHWPLVSPTYLYSPSCATAA